MNPKLKKRLRELFGQTAKAMDPSFFDDPAYRDDPQFCTVLHCAPSGQRQFIALSFSPTSDRFFLEVAIAADEIYPISSFPLGPDDPLNNGILRFRAAQLWNKSGKSGGWLIQKLGDELARDIVFPPEGIFVTAEAAMVDVRERMVRWILPYLAKAGGSQRHQ